MERYGQYYVVLLRGLFVSHAHIEIQLGAFCDSLGRWRPRNVQEDGLKPGGRDVDQSN